MVRLGEGKLTVEDFSSALAARVRPRQAFTAPARGLCLEAVRYERT
ncbi:MAG: hypothetical protein JSW03_01730 [Candidatus Eiseniibacteriota bacterium]|nr:MAG: hypothetical protein JSW03_01730 [Candidatus Eisenbacteria bacterium]